MPRGGLLGGCDDAARSPSIVHDCAHGHSPTPRSTEYAPSRPGCMRTIRRACPGVPEFGRSPSQRSGSGLSTFQRYRVPLTHGFAGPTAPRRAGGGDVVGSPVSSVCRARRRRVRTAGCMCPAKQGAEAPATAAVLGLDEVTKLFHHVGNGTSLPWLLQQARIEEIPMLTDPTRAFLADDTAGLLQLSCRDDRLEPACSSLVGGPPTPPECSPAPPHPRSNTFA